MYNVEFAPDGSFAYRPEQILVPREFEDRTLELIDPPLTHARRAPRSVEPGWVLIDAVDRVLATVEVLRRRGIPAQPNHVLFATCGCGCGCGPHPADPRANPYYANPYYANPYYANPYYANPSAVNPNPGLSGMSETDEPARSSARPASAPASVDLNSCGEIRVTVLDTGFAFRRFAPRRFRVNPDSARLDVPDGVEGQDKLSEVPTYPDDRLLDPAAGHGTFIAGVIRQNSKNCDVTVLRVLSTFGVGDEQQIADALSELAKRDEDSRPHFVNLSFGGYSSLGMGLLTDAIEQLAEAKIVVVASAGNDATCLPMYPAAIPGVIGVAALDEHDNPAHFTNFGPWVRACTLGVDVVSTFFRRFRGQAPLEDGKDIDDFDGWARWSGTSFAAPRVVAALANELATNGKRDAAGKLVDPYQAVEALIDAKENIRMPMMGTIVHPVDETSWDWVRVATTRTKAE